MISTRRMFFILVTFLSLTLLLSGSSLATTHQVVDSAELSMALSIALSGDIIELAGGTYDWAPGSQVEVGLTMRGASGDPADAVIRLSALTDGIVDFHIVPAEETLRFEGLTFTGFNAPWSLIAHAGDLELEGCVFQDNTTLNVAGANGAISVQDCLFDNNSGQSIIYSNAILSVVGCDFRNNEADVVIMGEFGDISMTTTAITGNTGACVHIPNGDALFSHCLVQGNQGTDVSALQSGTGKNLEMDHCTVRDNLYSSGALYVGWGGQGTLHQCDILNNGTRDGHLAGESQTVFSCCDLDLSQWQLSGSYVVDNEDCTVAVVNKTWGGVKAAYR